MHDKTCFRRLNKTIAAPQQCSNGRRHRCFVSRVPTVKDVYLNRAHAIVRNQAIIYQNIIVTRDPELDLSVAGACIVHRTQACMQHTVNI